MPFGADPYGVFQVKLYLTSPVLFITSILLKRISGLGDRLAVSIMMAVPHEELFSPETARRAARLLRGAFASAHVECEIDRVPRVSLYLLDLWLARLEDPEVCFRRVQDRAGLAGWAGYRFILGTHT